MRTSPYFDLAPPRCASKADRTTNELSDRNSDCRFSNVDSENSLRKSTICLAAHPALRMASMRSHLPIFERPGMPFFFATS